MVAGGDRGPALGLGIGGRGEAGLEPRPHGRTESVQRHEIHGIPGVRRNDPRPSRCRTGSGGCDDAAVELPESVATAIARFLDACDAAVPELVVGLFVAGSLALGDYRSDRSDIDVVVVVRTPPDRVQCSLLAGVHRLAGTPIDGPYLTEAALAGRPEAVGPVPHHVDGRFEVGACHEVSPVTWSILAHDPITVRGRSPAEMGLRSNADSRAGLQRRESAELLDRLVGDDHSAHRGDRRRGDDRDAVARVGSARRGPGLLRGDDRTRGVEVGGRRVPPLPSPMRSGARSSTLPSTLARRPHHRSARRRPPRRVRVRHAGSRICVPVKSKATASGPREAGRNDGDDQHVIIEPNRPSTGVLVAFVEVNGEPVELMQIDHALRPDL